MDSIKLNDELKDIFAQNAWDQDEGSEAISLGQAYDPFDKESFRMLLGAKRWDVLCAVYLPKQSQSRRLFKNVSDQTKRALMIYYRGAMRKSWPSQSLDNIGS